MKNWVIITGLFLLAVSVACKKDTNPITTVPDPLPQPFIEYRDPFVGTFKGSLFSSYDVNYGGIQGPADTITTYNVTDTITKSLSNDSNIVSKLFNREFHVSANGQWNYYHPEYPILEIYNIRFRNDSVYIYRWRTMHNATTNHHYVSIYNGIKH